jgi:histidine triad (HIT) family protein
VSRADATGGPEPAQGALELGATGGPRRDDCVFCRFVSGEESAHLVAEDEESVAFLDARPLFPGHTLLVPRAHHETLPDLPPALLEPFFGRAQALATAMESALGAGGSFVALNNRISQSVPHLHVHVVPRRKKDGLRGFFWPRTRYADDADAAAVAARLRAALVPPT